MATSCAQAEIMSAHLDPEATSKSEPKPKLCQPNSCQPNSCQPNSCHICDKIDVLPQLELDLKRLENELKIVRAELQIHRNMVKSDLDKITLFKTEIESVKLKMQHNDTLLGRGFFWLIALQCVNLLAKFL